MDYTIFEKQYELSNHLGNVLAVIGDQKLPLLQGGVVVSFEAHVISSQDYSPFGVTLSGRSWSEGYRYGINTQEKVDEIKGSGNHYTSKFWEYDPSLGRRWNLDPRPQISISDYAAFTNNPISFVDPLGDKPIPAKITRKINRMHRQATRLARRTNQSFESALAAMERNMNPRKNYGRARESEGDKQSGYRYYDIPSYVRSRRLPVNNPSNNLNIAPTTAQLQVPLLI